MPGTPNTTTRLVNGRKPDPPVSRETRLRNRYILFGDVWDAGPWTIRVRSIAYMPDKTTRIAGVVVSLLDFGREVEVGIEELKP